MQKNFKYYSFIVRTFLIKILLKLLKILGKFNHQWKRPLFIHYSDIKIPLNSKYLHHTFKKVPFKELLKDGKNDTYSQNKYSNAYKWEKLIEDIKVNGIKKIPVGLRRLHENSPNITIDDGNHRLKALEVLYGRDYEVLISLYVPSNYIQYIKALNKHKKKLIKERFLNIKNKTKI